MPVFIYPTKSYIFGKYTHLVEFDGNLVVKYTVGPPIDPLTKEKVGNNLGCGSIMVRCHWFHVSF